MILSDRSIVRELTSGGIKVTPGIAPEDVRPVGVRVHLDAELLVPQKGQEIDLLDPGTPRFEPVRLEPGGYALEPHQFVLGTTSESVQLRSSLVGHLDGRSSLARLGLMIHCTAATIDNNKDEPRAIVLELCNVGPFRLRLHPGMPIGMLTFHQLSGPVSQPDSTQYRGQAGVRGPDLTFHASGKHLAEGYRGSAEDAKGDPQG